MLCGEYATGVGMCGAAFYGRKELNGVSFSSSCILFTGVA